MKKPYKFKTKEEKDKFWDKLIKYLIVNEMVKVDKIPLDKAKKAVGLS